MKRNNLLFIFILLFITGLSTFIYLSGDKKDSYKPGVLPLYDSVVGSARTIYQQKKQDGVDFSQGPCLSNEIMKDWVLDLVHNPRTLVDDLVANQCPALLEGRAKHFVEMDLRGNVLRIK